MTQASFTGDARRRLREADDEETQDEVDHFPVETIQVGGVLGSENLAHCRQERLLYRLEHCQTVSRFRRIN